MFSLPLATLFLAEASVSSDESGRRTVVWNGGTILERRAFIENGTCTGAEILGVNGEWREDESGQLADTLNESLRILGTLGMEVEDVAGKGLGNLADAPIVSISF